MQPVADTHAKTENYEENEGDNALNSKALSFWCVLANVDVCMCACVIFPSGILSIIQLANGVDREREKGERETTGFALASSCFLFRNIARQIHTRFYET
jgi:hypothetical protein